MIKNKKSVPYPDYILQNQTFFETIPGEDYDTLAMGLELLSVDSMSLYSDFLEGCNIDMIDIQNQGPCVSHIS